MQSKVHCNSQIQGFGIAKNRLRKQFKFVQNNVSIEMFRSALCEENISVVCQNGAKNHLSSVSTSQVSRSKSYIIQNL